MQKLLQWISLAILSLSLYAKAELLNKEFDAKQALEISIGTYNIAGGAAGFQLDLEKTAKAIKDMNVDFIALQEVDNGTNRSGNVNQAHILSELTGYNYIFAKAIDFDDGEYGMAVLSKHPITVEEVQQLPSGDYEQRIAMYVKADIADFEEPLLFIATHLDWHEDPTVRLDQLRAINGKAIDLRGIKFLLGDFNDTVNSVITKEALRHWDTVLDAPDVDHRTWPASNPEIGIDYVYTSKAQRWELKEVFMPNKPNGNYDRNWNEISDHIPVIVRLKLLEQ